MAISTMHERSCTDLHNSRKFEKKFRNAVIQIPCKHKYKIAIGSSLCIFLTYSKTKTQWFIRSFFTQLANHICYVVNIIENYRFITYKSNVSGNFQFTHICVHILYRFTDTAIIMTPLRRCSARDPQHPAYIFPRNNILHCSLWIAACKFRLRNVSNQQIHRSIVFIIKPLVHHSVRAVLIGCWSILAPRTNDGNVKSHTHTHARTYRYTQWKANVVSDTSSGLLNDNAHSYPHA